LDEKIQSLRDELMVAKEEIARSNLERHALNKEIVSLKQVVMKIVNFNCDLITDHQRNWKDVVKKNKQWRKHFYRQKR